MSGTAGGAPRPSAFAHTLVPIAAGYAIAHYFSLLVFDGQQTLILASDPSPAGWICSAPPTAVSTTA